MSVAIEESRRQLNVRISEHTMALVDKTAHFFRRTKVQVIEEAVQEYASKHGIGERYQLNIKNGMLVLLKLEGEEVDIVEMEALNGVAPEIIAQRYALRFHQNVPLVLDPKK